MVYIYIVLVNGELAENAPTDPVFFFFLVLQPKNHHLCICARVGMLKKTTQAQGYKCIFGPDNGIY